MPIGILTAASSKPSCQALPAHALRASCALSLLLGALAFAGRAEAQGRGAAAAGAASADAQADAPRVVRLPSVLVPPGLELGSDASLEVMVRVDADGHATLDESELEGPLRAAIEAALAQAVFEPARAHGVAMAARVRLRLSAAKETPPGDAAGAAAAPVSEAVAQPSAAAPAQPAPASTPAAAAPAQPAAHEPAAQTTPTFSARARVAKARANQQRLESEVMRDLPGAFGDPFRVLDTLPGVVLFFSGLPYVYVRGAPPSGTVYYYDDIQVPALFHLALGPAVVHPTMIGDVDFYPSVAPARYGRFTGGVLAGETCAAPCVTSSGGEAELRLIDVNGMVQTPLGDGGSLRVAGRFGYPGLILSALSPNVALSYWDYQTQLALPLNATDHVELTWFGSYDYAGERNASTPGQGLTLEFHRAEARLIRKLDRFEFATMLQGGYERSALQRQFEVSAFRLGPRAYVAWHDAAGVRLRVGGDFLGTTGHLRDLDTEDLNNLDFANPNYASVAARSMGGVYGELHLPLSARLDLDTGLRGDVWFTGTRAEGAVEPRATLSFRPLDPLTLHAAIGLGHQPAVFLIPLPGIADVGLDRGLQQAIQSEAGAALELGEGLRLESQFYLQRFTNMILPDAVLDAAETCGGLPLGADGLFGCNRKAAPRSSVWAYGLELFLRRDPSKDLSGWFSYTLGWADAHAEAGYDFTPSFDIRHVLNLVLQYRLGHGFSMGGRLHYRSGKVAAHTFVRETLVHYEQRLPGFFRADAEVAYRWPTSWGSMRVAAEWLNLTISREASGISCQDGVLIGKNPLSATPCTVHLAPAIFFPNVGVRAQF
jgi:outer membrane receptor protein involved in Fe transport